MSSPHPSIPKQHRTAMRAALLAWYDEHRRDLPWRRARVAYPVWISEIMLQQTRVGAVLEHYAEFLRRFPSVRKLAAATEAEVLAAWSGLGYYRRARMLHRAAQVIVDEHQGQFPRTAEEWRELPGIGRYTAAAIASIAFGEAEAVVDGNVERVLRRLCGAEQIPQAKMWELAAELLSSRRPGDFNQAMMELGATVCLPEKPRCESCPWRRWCRARGTEVARIATPRKLASASYVFAQRGGRVLLAQRAASESLMAAMWELPAAPANCNGRVEKFRHAILDTNYRVEVHCGPVPRSLPGARWVAASELPKMPLTGLCRKVLKRFGLL